MGVAIRGEAVETIPYRPHLAATEALDESARTGVIAPLDFSRVHPILHPRVFPHRLFCLMDRKAWIVIILCLAGMATNWWFANESYKAQAEAAKAAEALKPATAGPSDPGAKASAEVKAAPAVTQPTAEAVSEQTHQLTIGTVTYEFSTLGGGIKTATLADHEGVVLNRHSKSPTRHEPVGALRREATALDAAVYHINAIDVNSFRL